MSNDNKVPESSARLGEKVTWDGEDGLCLSFSPAKSVAALQEVTEAPRVVVHLQVKRRFVPRRVEEVRAVAAVPRSVLTAKLKASRVTHS